MQQKQKEKKHVNHTHTALQIYSFQPLQGMFGCNRRLRGWRLSLVTWGPVPASVRSYVYVPVYERVHVRTSVSVCTRACIWIYVARRRLFIFIVFNERPVCRIHNNTINPQQQQQHGYNLYGNAGSMDAPSHTVDISDSGQHGCAAAS